MEAMLLHDACRADDAREAMRLLGTGMDVNAPDSEGWTGLHYCAFFGRVETCLSLVGKGADIEARTGDLETPLHFAVNRDNAEMTQLMIDHGACIEAEDTYGETALHGACSNGYSEAVYVLLKAGADTRATNKKGYCPVHLAPICDGHTRRLMWRVVVFVPLLARANIPADLIREFTNYV